MRISHVSMTRFIFREGFISGVQTYLSRDSYIVRNSHQEFRYTYGRNRI